MARPLIVAERPDLDLLLAAGRRAALAALYDQERNKTVPGSINKPPDSYDGKGELLIMAASLADVDIGPAIDAAVLEAVAQMGAPLARLRPWWKFWA